MDTDQFLRDLDLDDILENEGGLESVFVDCIDNVINSLNKYGPEKKMTCVQLDNKLGTVMR